MASLCPPVLVSLIHLAKLLGFFIFGVAASVSLFFCIISSAAISATINFDKAPLREVIDSISVLTGRNFMLDDRIRGNVTIVANSEVPDDAIYDIFLSILRMNGLRAVPAGNNLIRIVPASTSLNYSPIKAPESLRFEIIGVRYLNASEVVAIIRPLMTKEGQLLVHKLSNSLIINDTLANVERVKNILSKFDVASTGSFEMVFLENTDVKDIVQIVSRARNRQTRHLTEVVADVNANRVILVGPEEFRLPLRALIAELDTPAYNYDSDGTVVRVVHLNYANSEEIETVLKGLLTKQFLTQKKATVEDNRAAVIDVNLSEAVSSEAQKSGRTMLQSGGANDIAEYTLQSDKAINALIISARRPIVEIILRVVKQLDIPRPQVLIEAIIAELSLNRSASLQSRLSFSRNGDTLAAGSNSAVITSLRGIFTAFDFIPVNNAVPGGIYYGGGRVGNLNFGLLVQALRTDGNANILSTPSIMTLNNEEAKIIVGENRSFATGTGELNSGNTFTRFERRDVATSLVVTPQITQGETVRLTIEQTVESVIPGSAVGESTDPATRKRQIITKVAVSNKDVIVLGGLTEATSSETENRIPLISDIPVLGNLFRRSNKSNTRRNLTVFIRPTIYRGAVSATVDSRERYAKLRLEQLYNVRTQNALFGVKVGGTTILRPLQPQKREKPKKRRKKMRKVSKGASGS